MSVISGRWEGDNERCAMEPRLGLGRFPPPAVIEPGKHSHVDRMIISLASVGEFRNDCGKQFKLPPSIKVSRSLKLEEDSSKR